MVELVRYVKRGFPAIGDEVIETEFERRERSVPFRVGLSVEDAERLAHDLHHQIRVARGLPRLQIRGRTADFDLHTGRTAGKASDDHFDLHTGRPVQRR